MQSKYTEKMVTEYGKRLSAARKGAGLTQAALAKKVGMTQGTISELEKIGHGSAFTHQLATICKVNPHWLATGDGDKRIKVATNHHQERAGLSEDALELGVYFDHLTDPGDRTRAYVAAMAVILKIEAERAELISAQATKVPAPSENPKKQHV